MYKSSNTCQKVLLIKIVVVHKLPNSDASVFDVLFYYNISRSNSTSRGRYMPRDVELERDILIIFSDEST